MLTTIAYAVISLMYLLLMISHLTG